MFRTLELDPRNQEWSRFAFIVFYFQRKGVYLLCTVKVKIIEYVHLKNQEVDLLQFFPHVKMPF
jgi:hypothetical protein